MPSCLSTSLYWLQRSVLVVAMACAACSGGSGGSSVAGAGGGGGSGGAGEQLPYTPPVVSGSDYSAVLEHTGGAETPSEYRILATHHPQGVALIVRAYLPDNSALSAAGVKYPVVFGYHGSGGLFQEDDVGNPCTKTLESNYREMTEFFLSKGVAVIWIDSFTSRDSRFCEDKNGYEVYGQQAAPYMDSNLRQVVSRVYDTVAAEAQLCTLARIDCSRMARIGTSEGGTAVLVPSHHALVASIAQLFDASSAKNRLGNLQPVGAMDPSSVVVWPIPASRPQPRFVMAISPGCGFYGAIPTSYSGSEADMDLFYPTQPTYLELGSNDNIPDDCHPDVLDGTGERLMQANILAERWGIAPENNLYIPTVYPGGGHNIWGFATDAIRAKLNTLVNTHLLAP